MSFLDVLRQQHPEIQLPKRLIAHVIDLISSQESLGARPHLRRIFCLSCLCLDEPRKSFAPVKFGSHRTDDPLSSMFDVIAPIQSYLGYVTHGLYVLTSDTSVSRSLPLEQSFGNSGHTDIHSPWDSVDHFDRALIRKTLQPSVASKESSPKVSVPEKNSALKSFPVPKPCKRRSHLGPVHNIGSCPSIFAERNFRSLVISNRLQYETVVIFS